MDYAVTAQQMKEIDQNTINGVGIPSMVLMERAALAVAEAAERMAAERKLGKKARILAVCGTGNNGADGVAAGRILQGLADMRQSFCLPEIRNMIQKR